MGAKVRNRMQGYYDSVIDAYDAGKLTYRVARKLLRTATPHQFYECLYANGYMGDVWDAIEGKDKYPWKKE